MRLLPRLANGPHLWELPLADCSARVIEEALLAPSLVACQAVLERLLKEDPALLLWAVCQGDLIDGKRLSTCRLAAQWLADHLLAQLDWSTFPEGAPTLVPSAVAERYARLAGTRVATARLARQLAEATDDVCPDEAEAAGLLFAAAAWGEDSTDHSVASGLPKWITKQCVAGGRGKVKRTRRDGPWQIAARAAAICGATSDAGATATSRGATQPDPPATRELADEAEDLRQRVVATWRAHDDSAPRRLAALAIKLRRLDTLERQFHTQLEAEKLEAMKELAYGAGHEINNPLANISARAQTLIKEELDPERRRKLAAINSQAFRAHEMIADLMLFARPPKLESQPIDLAELVDTVIAELTSEAQSRGTTLERRGTGGPVEIVGDRVQLAVALRALAVNSLEALGSGGQVLFEVDGSSGRPDEPWATLVVTDTGPGIKPEIRHHLFDPFFSGREAGRGLGFGLSKCWRIVTDHSGRIVVASPKEGGTSFTLYLPVAKRGPSTAKAGHRQSP